MAEAKTKPTTADVDQFLDHVPDPGRRAHAKALCALIHDLTGEKPVLWGPSIVGFGSYHYRYASGHEGDAPLYAFSPRAKELVVYLSCDGTRSQRLLDRLGKHRSGKSCLYIKSLAEVDRAVLTELIVQSAKATQEKYPGE